jgi:hypothetical protein
MLLSVIAFFGPGWAAPLAEEELLVRLRGEAVGERLRLALEFGPKVTSFAGGRPQPAQPAVA